MPAFLVLSLALPFTYNSLHGEYFCVEMEDQMYGRHFSSFISVSLVLLLAAAATYLLCHRHMQAVHLSFFKQSESHPLLSVDMLRALSCFREA